MMGAQRILGLAKTSAPQKRATVYRDVFCTTLRALRVKLDRKSGRERSSPSSPDPVSNPKLADGRPSKTTLGLRTGLSLTVGKDYIRKCSGRADNDGYEYSYNKCRHA
jgi:hypothetical protein